MKYVLVALVFSPNNHNPVDGQEDFAFIREFEDDELPRVGELFHLDERDIPMLVVTQVVRGAMSSQESKVDYREVTVKVHWPMLPDDFDARKMYKSFRSNRLWETK